MNEGRPGQWDIVLPDYIKVELSDVAIKFTDTRTNGYTSIGWGALKKSDDVLKEVFDNPVMEHLKEETSE